MEQDTDGTVAAWQAARQDVIKPSVTDHSGKIVKLTGDGFLVEFSTVQDAVNCAIAMQRGLASSSLDFRMGVNLGDIVDDGEDIHVEGVNVAARLEGLADPGGILISGDVYNQVRNRVDAVFEDMGQQEVKNVSQPVRAFRVVLDGTAQALPPVRPPVPARWWWTAGVIAALGLAAVVAAHLGVFPLRPPAEKTKTTLAQRLLPDKPSIAVLPFDNLSADAEQGYFADGITEDIITTLSKIPEMFVISRSSMFTYKGKAVRVQQVGEELGVRYVLEGSVRKSGTRLRVTAQLIEAATENHVWANRYDREVEDLFVVQDEITSEIVTALQVKLTDGEQARLWRKHTRSIEVWETLMQGLDHFHRFSREENALARRLFEKAIDMDRGYALAYALAAWTHWIDFQNNWASERAIEDAAALAERARALDAELPDVYALQGGLLLFKREYDAAIAAAEKAVALNLSHATNTALLALILNQAGDPARAVSVIKTAMRLSPYYPSWFVQTLGFAHLGTGEYAAALAAFDEVLERAQSPFQRAEGLFGPGRGLGPA